MRTKRKDRIKRIGKSTYPVRTLGFVFFSLGVYMAQTKSGAAIDLWSVLVIGVALTYPHLAYWRYIKNPKREIELQHMLCDMGLQGVMMAMVNFTPVISLPYLISSSAANYALRGIKQSLKGVIIAITTATVTGLLLSKEFILHADGKEMIGPLIYLIVVTHFMGFLAYVRGVALVRHRKAAESQAKLDFLTGLNNRRSMYSLVQQNEDSNRASSDQTSLIMVDLDHFKQVNDQFGHVHGDAVLIEIGQLLKDSIRETDFVARWGGEEFLVLLPSTDIDQCFKVAEKIRQAIADQVFYFRDQEHHLTATLGIASYNATSNFESTIKAADKALYNGKKKGRNRVVPIEENPVTVDSKESRQQGK